MEVYQNYNVCALRVAAQGNNCYNTSMLPEPLNTLKKKPILSLYIAGAALLVLGVLLWCFKVSVGPERVFWATVNQGLATSAVTIQANQKSGSAEMHQTTQYSLGPNSMSHTLTHVQQGGTNVVNELIGTPTTDYTRYVSVHTDQKGKDGKPLNLSKVVGVWAKGDASNNAQLFSQGVLGVGLPLGGIALPIGNLDAGTRAKMVREIQNDVVYQVDFKKVTSKRDHGRLLYTYNVGIQPVSYAKLMQQFAQKMGLHDLDSLDPAQFKGQRATQMKLTIDVRAHHLVAAEVPANNARQAYTSYDIPSHFPFPKNTISVQELQQRLSHL